MIKKFTKRQLLDQCGFTADESKIILDYQKKLPILVENDSVEGFCVNARDLHKELQVKRQFSKWINTNISAGGFSENIDFIIDYRKGNQSVVFKDYANFSAQKLSALGISKEYLLTIDTAKEISMFTGAYPHISEELKNLSRLVRQYFLLMEKAIKRNANWELIRYPLKEGYKSMQKALDDYMMRMVQRHADDWDYRFEADALNIIATGFKAQDIRLYVGCKDNITRDSLTATYNEYLLKLQELNIIYLGMNMNRYDRYKMLKQSFDILFPNAIPIKDDTDIVRIQENKQKLLNDALDKTQVVA